MKGINASTLTRKRKAIWTSALWKRPWASANAKRRLLKVSPVHVSANIVPKLHMRNVARKKEQLHFAELYFSIFGSARLSIRTELRTLQSFEKLSTLYTRTVNIFLHLLITRKKKKEKSY